MKPSNTIISQNKLVNNFIELFRPNFQNQTFKYTIYIIKGVILFGYRSINAIFTACIYIEKINQSVINQFINNTTWYPKEINEKRLRLLQTKLQIRPIENENLIIAVPITKKTGIEMRCTSYYYSNSKKVNEWR